MAVSTLAHMHHVGCGAMIGRAAWSRLSHLSKQRRVCLSAAMRVLDAHIASSSYCIIAEALFAQRRIPDRAWKMHDLRNRTIRLVQSDLALMRTLAQAAAAQAQGLTQLLRRGYRKIVPASSASP
ncbi:DNA -binding domain-containing protein [Bradyrhizobium sp. BR 1433]|uniref:DNA -binding domain-containing protein n=1 Tax=Bradyrhizobium sp. BR 1433 TaxID=3447967 RepID=UPI003EE74CDF